MATTESPSTLISFDKKGRAILAGTTYKVVEIALDHQTHGWGPEEIRRQHDNAFSLAQVYAALSSYFEHQAAFDEEIAHSLREYEDALRQQGETPFVRRMKAAGLL